MHILFIGDLVGRPGRICLNSLMDSLRNRWPIDLVIANGENAAGGFGITAAVFAELKESGVDVVTGGNHIWDNKEVYGFIDRETCLIRPANYPADTTPGNGSVIVEAGGIPVGILNLCGRIFMPPLDCPFRRADEEVATLNKKAAVILVDFHAEATAEKQALGWYLDGRVSAVVGTHMHVQTADERILPRGTAYISDVGFTGLYNSVLGVDPEPALQKFITQLPGRFTISEGEMQLNAVIVQIDPATGRAQSINRIFEVIKHI
ncbi:MAG: TIGR00282 family metallophosphoesterase [Bacillota bacterium]